MSRFAGFSLGELDAIARALAALKRELEGPAYSLTVSKLNLEAVAAFNAAYRAASPDERLAVERRIAGDSGLTSLERRLEAAGDDELE